MGSPALFLALVLAARAGVDAATSGAASTATTAEPDALPPLRRLPPPDALAPLRPPTPAALGGDLRPLVEPAGQEKSLAIPAAEVLGISGAIWSFDRFVGKEAFAEISGDSILRNLRGGWFYDDDDFQTNLFLHPYQGHLYFTAARSNGLSFWQSAPYSFGGSLLWELALETQAPSINDQITTSIGGALLGETLFRISRLLRPGGADTGAVRGLASAAVAPMNGLNGMLLGDRRLAAEPVPEPWRGRLALGTSLGDARASAASVRIPAQGRLSLEITYGTPERVELREPFDHFQASLDFASSTLQPWNHLSDATGPSWALLVRGLLAGTAVRAGEDGRALLGLFGTLDYAGPTWLRAAATGLGPGAVIASRPLDDVGFEATVLAAATFGSAGGKTPPVTGGDADRDYRFGFGALVSGDARVTFWDRLELRGGARLYLVPEAVQGCGGEGLLVGNAAALVRLGGPNALSLDARLALRRVRYTDASFDERARYVGLSYTLLLGGSGE